MVVGVSLLGIFAIFFQKEKEDLFFWFSLCLGKGRRRTDGRERQWCRKSKRRERERDKKFDILRFFSVSYILHSFFLPNLLLPLPKRKFPVGTRKTHDVLLLQVPDGQYAISISSILDLKSGNWIKRKRGGAIVALFWPISSEINILTFVLPFVAQPNSIRRSCSCLPQARRNFLRSHLALSFVCILKEMTYLRRALIVTELPV